MNAAFFCAIRPLFDGALTQANVDGINSILDAWKTAGTGNRRDLAYILATAYHETAHTMQPVKETGNATNPNPADSLVKQRLTKAWKAGKMRWVKSDYWSGGWFGRGFVQLTHKANYETASKKLGVDLIANPDKAMIPEVAAIILVRGMVEGWFTGKKLADYPNDFVLSRAIVNGKDRAGDIAAYAYTFLAALEAGEAVAAPKPADPAAPKWSLIGAIIDLVKAILVGLRKK